jgi:hypothetical protein
VQNAAWKVGTYKYRALTNHIHGLTQQQVVNVEVLCCGQVEEDLEQLVASLSHVLECLPAHTHNPFSGRLNKNAENLNVGCSSLLFWSMLSKLMRSDMLTQRNLDEKEDRY